MPSKEEHDAREKLKEAEKKAKAPRKTPVPRTTKPPVKKAPGRPTKSTKSVSPSEQSNVPTPVAAPETSQIEVAAKIPLEQPQPTTMPEVVPALVEKPNGLVSSREESSALSPRQSLGIIEPPTELMEMSITPEQLPVPPFVDVSSEPAPLTVSPPRPDTPPPPPPSCIPKFVQTNSHNFGTPSPFSNVHMQAEKQWIAPKIDVTVPAAATTPAPAGTLFSPIRPNPGGGRERPLGGAGDPSPLIFTVVAVARSTSSSRFAPCCHNCSNSNAWLEDVDSFFAFQLVDLVL
jgi:histone deacetylase HOS3